MANMEEEMARFEEEIFTPGQPPGNNFDSGPPPMPQPMFLPHSLNRNTPSRDDNPNKPPLNNGNNMPGFNFGKPPSFGLPGNETISSESGPMGNPQGSGPMGLGGPSGPGQANQMFPPGFMGPGVPHPWPDTPFPGGPNGPIVDSAIGPMPPPMPDFFPPPVLPNFADMMPPVNPQTVYSSAPVLKKKKVVPVKKPKPVVVEPPKQPDPEEELRRKKEELDRKIEEKIAAHQNPNNPAPNKFATTSNMPAPLYGGPQPTGNTKKKKIIRTAAGQKWEDSTLLEWDPNDYRIFCGDLGNEVTDDSLARVFNKYSSFQKARVIREKNSKKSKGYGFVSFKDPTDFIRAMREMQGKYVGNRPIKLRKSNWKDRNIDTVRKKTKEKKKLGYKV